VTALSDLLTTQTQEQVFGTLLSVYQAYGFPTQNWQPGGVERTRLNAFATVITDLVTNAIPTLAAGGFLDYANTDWLRLLAEQLYNIAYNQATYTIGSITLTNASSASYTIAAGDLIAVFGASGNRYINTTGGTLNALSDLTLTFRAEFAGAAYNDASNSGNLSLVSPLPGVTLTNPSDDYSDVAQVGSGTGTLTLGGSPTGFHSVRVRVDATSASNPATVSTSVDGAPYVSQGAVSSLTNLGGYGINITFVNGGSGTSWVLDDVYSFNTPGSWISTQGSDAESDANLIARCRARWSSASSDDSDNVVIPVSNFYRLLATSTPGVGSQVTTVIVQPDSVISAQVNMVVAGPAGVLPPATVAAIQTYVTPRVPGTERCVVVSPSTQTVTLAATITVSAALRTTAQGQIETAMTNYVSGVGINGVVRIAEIIDAVMSVEGVVDITSVTINGVAANLTLGSTTLFVLPVLQPLSFTYATV
jgi:hypothetical protein